MSGVKGRSGRKKKPHSLHVLQGTARNDRPDTSAKVPDGIPACPATLSPIGKKKWKEAIAVLAKVPGLLSTMDGDALYLYCRAWQDLHNADQLIKKHGQMIKTHRGGLKINPAYYIKQSAIDQIWRGISRFGMSPSDRSSLKLSGEQEDNDPFTDYIRKHGIGLG